MIDADDDPGILDSLLSEVYLKTENSKRRLFNLKTVSNFIYHLQDKRTKEKKIAS